MIFKYGAIFAVIFTLAFAANLAWEFSHAALYVHYKGGDISNLILLRAALFDAFFITALGAVVFAVPFLKKRLWIAFILSVVFAIGLEWFALSTGRWAYTEAMPIIPFLGTGLSPTIQLGLIGVIIYFFTRRHITRNIFKINTKY